MPQPSIQEVLTGRQASIPSRGQRLRIRPTPKRILTCPPEISTVRLPKSRSTRTWIPATAARTQRTAGALLNHTTSRGTIRAGRETATMVVPNCLMQWAQEALGGTSHFHDHFSVPSSELSPEARESVLAVHPQFLEMFQRYSLTYHLSDSFYSNHDHNLMGFVIEEAVYAPLYYGYGGPDSGAPKRSPEGQRTGMARRFEGEMLAKAPGTVLVLLKAGPEVIRRRMQEAPHEHPIVREPDVEHVLARFEEEFEASLIQRRIVLDTSTATVEESLAELLERYQPFMSRDDRLRMDETKRTRS